MPTTRPRHVVTETVAIAAALDDAARRWPAERDSRSKLLLRLVAEGHRALQRESERRRNDRIAAIERTRGALTGSYGPDDLARLHDEWPP